MTPTLTGLYFLPGQWRAAPVEPRRRGWERKMIHHWYIEMTAEEAKKHLGAAHWDRVSTDKALASRLRQGAWDCNNQLNFASYCAAERAAERAANA